MKDMGQRQRPPAHVKYERQEVISLNQETDKSLGAARRRHFGWETMMR